MYVELSSKASVRLESVRGFLCKCTGFLKSSKGLLLAAVKGFPRVDCKGLPSNAALKLGSATIGFCPGSPPLKSMG